MERYFFDVDDGTGMALDTVGQMCPNKDAMRLEALKALPDMVRDLIPNGNELKVSIRVRNDEGKPVFELTLEMSSRWL